MAPIKEEVIVPCPHHNGGCEGYTRVIIHQDGSRTIIEKEHKLMILDRVSM